MALTLVWLASPGYPAQAHNGSPEQSAARGQRLFNGDESLQGILSNHKQAMPPEAVRCANCHSVVNPPPAWHTWIGRDWLVDPHPRRNASPTSYDETSFCRLLRTGIDPNFIVIDQLMPHFNPDAAQCGSFWLYLTEENDVRH